MKKFILALFAIILLSSSNINPASAETKVQSIVLAITEVTYNEHDNRYYAFTENDEGGLNWGLVIIDKSLPNSKTLLKLFSKAFISTQVEIFYEGDLLNDGCNVELIDYAFLD